MKFNSKFISLLIAVLVAPAFLLTCSGRKIMRADPWYSKDDWWNYCSNGNLDNEAIKGDIGKKVKVTLNGLEHEVRLIDIDHDELANNPNTTAHCTFEFVNLITKVDGNAYQTFWNIYDGTSSTNFDFINYSTLSDALKDGGDIYNMFPNELINKMVEVNKYVGVSKNSGTSYAAIFYKTKLFPLAFIEIDRLINYEVPNEGFEYAYYQGYPTIGEAKKTVGGSTSEAYWLRSPNVIPESSNYTNALYVINDGGYRAGPVYAVARAVAPAFCI